MKSWQKALLLATVVIGLVGGAGWWWIADDTVRVKSKNTEVIIQNAEKIGGAKLDKEQVKKILDELDLGEQKQKVYFRFEEYKDQDFSGMMVLMKGSIVSVGTMMCSKPELNKNGANTILVFASPEVFGEKYGKEIALERENYLVLLCISKGLGGSDEKVKWLMEQKITVIKSLDL